MEKVNLSEKLGLFSDLWSPKIVGELNGQHVKLAKLRGEFVWHHHENEDELFLVLRGSLTIHLSDRVVKLSEGEFFIVPKGWSTSPSPKTKLTFSCSSPCPPSTRGTSETSAPSTRPTTSNLNAQ